MFKILKGSKKLANFKNKKKITLKNYNNIPSPNGSAFKGTIFFLFIDRNKNLV